MMAGAKETLDLARARGFRLAIAESCTGGMISAALTDIPGSSDVFECGFVVYSNDAKVDMLGVAPTTLIAHGAVSAQTACEMAEGALRHSHADISVSVTGIAGPAGGTDEKPVGLVYIALARRGANASAERHFFPGDRAAVRRQTAEAALAAISRVISSS